MKRAFALGSVIVLVLLGVVLWRERLRSDRQPANEELFVSLPPENSSFLSVWAADDERWLAMGTIVRGGRRRVWTLHGDGDGPTGSAVLLPGETEMIIRAAAWLPDGHVVAVGETAVAGSRGPLGHSLYRGLILLLDANARIVAQQVLGPPGVTGFTTVALGDGKVIAGGTKDRAGWLVTLRPGDLGTLSEGATPEWAGMAAMAAHAHQVVIGGEAGARTVGLGRGFVVALDQETQAMRWRWDAGEAAGSAITHVVRVATGWMALGAIEEAGRRQVWMVALDDEGHARWQRTLPVEAQVAGGCALVAVGSDMVRAVICAAHGGERYATELMDIATEDGTVRATHTVEEGPARAYGLGTEGGHLLGIDRFTGEPPLQAMLLALDRELRVEWSVEALDALGSP